jgi:two-component system, cell cycle sensor histidine kinase and response regulator CckA
MWAVVACAKWKVLMVDLKPSYDDLAERIRQLEAQHQSDLEQIEKYKYAAAKHKQTEESLFKKEQLLSESQRIARLGNWEYDYHTNTSIWSAEIYRILEIDPKTQDYNEAFWRAIHPEDLEMVRAAFDRSLEDHAPYENSYRILLPDGRIKYVQAYCESYCDSDGKPIRAVGTIQDITRSKNVEDALRESEERFQQLYDHMADGVAIYQAVDEGQDFVFVDINKCGQTLSKVRKEEVLGRKVTEVFSAVEQMGLLDVFRRVWQSGWTEHHPSTVYADGRIREYLENCVYKLPSGLIVAIYSDTSVQHKTEEALKQSERNYREIFNNVSDAIFIHDAETGKILDVNSAALQMYGISHEAALNLTPRDMNPGVSPYSEIEAMQRLRNATTIGPQVFEWQSRKIDGTLFWVEISLKSAEIGGKRRVLALVHNLTERKKKEEENARLSAQLEQAQKLESVGRLAGGVAHDFNNMLGVIIGRTEMALVQMDPVEPIHEDLMEIQKAARRSVDLTRQLLAFARKQAIAPQILSLNETIVGTLNMLKRMIGENIELIWQPEANLWPIMADASQIDQILTNLCVNARDAISDVGQITIEVGNCTVDADYCSTCEDLSPGEYVRLVVKDNGCGMDKSVLDHVFEPFFTTKNIGKGTGLGLATVYGAVKQNSGFIHIESEPGVGTTVSIYFPRKEEAPKQQTSIAASARQAKETILLVEDEPGILKMTSKVLLKQGYKVLATGSPAEALRLAKAHTGEIHLLMTDVIMPEMNGRRLAQNLQSIRPNIKCLFMSGYTADIIAKQGILDEGVCFIQKPFSAQALADKLSSVLG